MKEDDARNLLLIRAVETEDAAQALLTREDRQAATASALAAEIDNGSGRRADQRFLASRSAFALARLTARHPVIGRAARATRWPGWLDWALPLAAIGLGVATNELAGGKRLNIIAFPLFGILLWNLAVYLLIATHAARGFFLRSDPEQNAPWIARAAGWVGGIARRDQDPHHPVGRTVARFARDWAKHAGALTFARATRVLHLSAAALAIGVVAGMYLRALGVEYRAGWESTFIGAQSLHRVLGWVLAPASVLTGITLPDVDQLAALRWGMPANGENAASWIHLYAATAALFVILPRLALSTWSALSAARLSRFFKVPGREDFYVRRVLRDGRGSGTRVRVVPYGFAFPDGHRRVLERLLIGTFGDDTAIETEDAIAYAGEEEWLAGLQLREDDDYLMVLFNLAATPEVENHGELLAGISRLLADQRSGTALAVLLDETGYRARLSGQAGADQRIEARRSAWKQLTAATSVSPIGMDLGAGESPEQSRRLEAALLGQRALAGGRRMTDEIDSGGGGTVNLSLVSHTNAGKTTLVRTLLGQDVGEVRDAAHVTDQATGYVLVQAGGDTLMLWDTPGFGDTGRLLKRLRLSDNPVGWLLTQVWDRFRERPLWSSQQAVRNAREHADVVLYLVNAAEDPAGAAYVPLEMELLAWIGKPVILLLNQMGPPRADARDEVERWRTHLAPSGVVAGALPLDAFARCWVQEATLLDTARSLLPAAKQTTLERLTLAWRERNLARFQAAMRILAAPLAAAVADREHVADRNWQDKLGDVLSGLRREAPAEARRAMASLADRLEAGTRSSTEQLIDLHGLTGNAVREVLQRLRDDYASSVPAKEGYSAMLGGLMSGAVGGLAADLAAGGLTLGGGMIVGGLLGAIGAGGLARGYNMARGEEGSTVRWSEEFFMQLVQSTLLRYLAVAHFGRGRGDYAQGEHPEFWQAAVADVAGGRRAEFRAIWESGKSDTDDAVPTRIAALVFDCTAELLARLYPDARNLFFGAPTPLAATPDATGWFERLEGYLGPRPD